MMNNDFEKGFSDFLECQQYDEAENIMFELIRSAFIAGWKAAGGDPPGLQKFFTVHRPDYGES